MRPKPCLRPYSEPRFRRRRARSSLSWTCRGAARARRRPPGGRVQLGPEAVVVAPPLDQPTGGLKGIRVADGRQRLDQLLLERRGRGVVAGVEGAEEEGQVEVRPVALRDEEPVEGRPAAA